MRVIETKMVHAIAKGSNMQNGNTTVTHDKITGDVRVYLHGNHIATVTKDSVSFTLADWNTNTTRSRVNAILGEYARGFARVYTKQGTASLVTAKTAATRENEMTRELRNDEWLKLDAKVW